MGDRSTNNIKHKRQAEQHETLVCARACVRALMLARKQQKRLALTNLLVGLKVKGELGVVLLDEDLGGLLDSLGANTTHGSGSLLCEVGKRGWCWFGGAKAEARGGKGKRHAQRPKENRKKDLQAGVELSVMTF